MYELYSEEARWQIVRHWLRVRGQRHMLYNIDNRHQCFAARPPAIVRPFRDVSYFYACETCGKYHFCYGSSVTCETTNSSTDTAQDRATCLYSGKAVKQVNSVVGSFWGGLQAKEDARCNDFDDYSKKENAVAALGETGCETLNYQRASRALQKEEKRAKRDLSHTKELSLINQVHATRCHKKQKLLTTSGGGGGTDVRVITQEEMGMGDAEWDVKEEGGGGEQDSPVREEGEDEEKEKEGQEGEEEEEEEEESMDEEMCDPDEEDGGGEGTLFSTDGDSGYMKNLHNNCAYWDEYYAFLSRGGPVGKEHQNPDIMLMREHVPLLVGGGGGSTQIKEEPVGGPLPLESHGCSDIYRPKQAPAIEWNMPLDLETDIRRIVGLILSVSEEGQGEEEEDRARQKAYHESLTRYYSPIAHNIAILVYHSPYLQRLMSERGEKHEKQGKSSYTTKISVSITDITSLLKEEGEENGATVASVALMASVRDFLPVEKLCASLMLVLFADAFRMTDSMHNHVTIWAKDPWLAHLKETHLFDRMIMDYALLDNPLRESATKEGLIANQHHYKNLFFRKDLINNATLIRNALSAYDVSPLWLNTVIHQRLGSL